MRDYFDPIYGHSSSVKGEPYTGASRAVKKSHSIVGISGGSGNVLGRFLKIGKSRSDVHSRPKSRASSVYNGDLEEDFRLSPSVLNRERGPVEKMVHKSNSRKDLSRSHSWIYGSVKLPSDLPFGYGYSPSGSDESGGSGSGSPNYSGGGQQSSQPLMQIPRCQMSEYYMNSGCECGSGFDFLTGEGSEAKLCKSCAYQWTVSGGGKNGKSSRKSESFAKLTWKSLKQAVKKRPSLDNIKKQGYEAHQLPYNPQELSLIAPNPNGFDYNGNSHHHRMNGFFSYSTPQASFSADDLQPSYFFPEKKQSVGNVYASCTELFRGDSHATASVRVRPKPSRQSWQFTNGGETGPVPNYQEDNGINNVYHSEWDLRQCIPYDVWVNTTSKVKPRTNLPPSRSKTPTTSSRNSSLSKATSVPYLSEIGQSGDDTLGRGSTIDSFSLKKKSSSSNAVNADSVSIRSIGSSKSSSVKVLESVEIGHSVNAGIVKRPSILSADANAYQLTKAQAKKSINTSKQHSSSKTPLVKNTSISEDALSSSSDDLSDNALTSDSHMRIGGQKIYMPPNLKRNQSSCSAKEIAKANNGKSSKQNFGPRNQARGWEEQDSDQLSMRDGRDANLHAKKGIILTREEKKGTNTSLSHRNYDNNQPSEPSPIFRESFANNYNNYDGQSQIVDQEVDFEEYEFEESENFPSNEDVNVVSPIKASRTEPQKTTNNVNKVSSSSFTEGPSSALGSNCNGNKTNGNSSGKFGALRRRKSRNGSNNPGKLLREVIYEEEMETEQCQNLTQISQRSDKEHAVKIVVSHSPPAQTPSNDYVKPILKNRERVYDTPINKMNESGDVNEIYFDSSASVNSTLKKRVQFDSNKIIVCGGDSGPDSDDYGINDDEKCREESGSVSNSSRKLVALGDNDDNLTQNFNQLRQKTRSSFEEEVARKAASFAASRKKNEDEALRLTTSNNNKNNSGNINEQQGMPKEQGKVNELNNPDSTTNSNMTKKKSNLKKSTFSQGNGTSSTITTQISAATLPKRSTENNNNSGPRHFIKNSKASSSVAAQIMKAKRMANGKNSPNSNATNDGSKDEVIINPNSLLFNDTTRIRLNQSRPSLNETFKLNLSQNGQEGKGAKAKGGLRLKQSSSFRSLGSVALRPKEPPPPPPPAVASSLKNNAKLTSSISSQLDKILTKSSSASQIYGGSLNGNRLLSKSEISLPMDLQTTSNVAVKKGSTQKVNGSTNHNNNSSNKNSGFEAKTSGSTSTRKINETNANNGSKSFAERCEALDKIVGQYKSNNTLHTSSNNNNNASTPNRNGKKEIKGNLKTMKQSPKTLTSKLEPTKSQIEIVTKENSVSEIRIYSDTNSIVASKNLANNDTVIMSSSEIHYATTELFPKQSTSVVLILDDKNAKPSSSSPLTYSTPIDTLSTQNLPQNQPPEDNDDGLESEPLYDDVIVHQRQAKATAGSIGRKFLNSIKKQLPQSGETVEDQAVVLRPPSLPPPNLPSKTVQDEQPNYCDMMTNDSVLDEEVDNLYNDISDGGNRQESKSLSFTSSMKGALLNAIKNMQDFDKRSLISNVSNNSGGSQNSSSTLKPEPANSDNFIYDDTLSLRSENRFKLFDNSSNKSLKSHFPPPPSSVRSSSSTIKQLDNLVEQDETSLSDENEPLYDDVIGYSKTKGNSSDSGAESEDAIPPPLPAQGPPKISTELPLLTFPLLLNRSNNNTNVVSPIAEEKVIGILLPPSKTTPTPLTPAQDPSNIIKTRSLLNELNEKLSQLNNLSLINTTNEASSSGKGPLPPLDFSSYSASSSNKAPISSSSESSGVEEDYNSEKNYSFSNNSEKGSGSRSSAEENYKLAQVTKLVTETITMARGKFLDSMKSTPAIVNRDNNSPDSGEEPIYEEIGGELCRSASPIYADAFDAKSIFEGASRNEILSFLESIRDRLTTSDSNSSGSQSSSISSKKGQEIDKGFSLDDNSANTLLAEFSSQLSTHIEEEDDQLSQNKLILRKLCPDCNDVPVDAQQSPGTVCPSCVRKRSERKEIITEIHETEIKYGNDLKIIMEEFYKPIQIAGLLQKEQLDSIFLNVLELSETSSKLTELLQIEIHGASDEDLVSVNIGKIFLEIGESMMTHFNTYCTRQANAGALLAQFEKEKELLRIFLRVSQMENVVLRRMNLPAFLMVPVQRVTRYPLLLSRLLKVTPIDHFSRDELQSAHEKIELHLEHMNKATREVASVKLWRRISIINNGSSTPLPRRSGNELEGASVSIRKMSIDVLDWAGLTDVTCVLDNQLGVFHFNGKPLRGIYACLLVRGKDLESLASKMDADMFFPPAEDNVKEVKLILVRVKNTRFCLLREPLCLSKCVVSQGENEFQDFVEINEITSKNTYHLQGMDKQGTASWLKNLQCYSMCVGQWRRRRGALANIMMTRIN